MQTTEKKSADLSGAFPHPTISKAWFRQNSQNIGDRAFYQTDWKPKGGQALYRDSLLPNCRAVPSVI